MFSGTSIVKRRSNRGIVLPTVLWISVLAITVGVSYASAVHLNTRAADNIKTAVMLKYDSISGIYLALDRLLVAPVDETTRYRLEFNDSKIDIEISPEHLKTNINTASAGQIGAAMIAAGMEPNQARVLAARVIDWRDGDHRLSAQGMEDAQYYAGMRDYGAKDGHIEDLSELLLITDFERQALAALSRFLTIHGGAGQRIYTITASSHRDQTNGPYATLAVVRVTGQHKPYQILKWRYNHG